MRSHWSMGEFRWEHINTVMTSNDCSIVTNVYCMTRNKDWECLMLVNWWLTLVMHLFILNRTIELHNWTNRRTKPQHNLQYYLLWLEFTVPFSVNLRVLVYTSEWLTCHIIPREYEQLSYSIDSCHFYNKNFNTWCKWNANGKRIKCFGKNYLVSWRGFCTSKWLNCFLQAS